MSMRRTRETIFYGLALAVGAFALHWLEMQYAIRLFSTEIYIILLASLSTAMGIWIGARLQGKTQALPFEKNDQVIRTLGLTRKELEVLELLAEGGSNQEIAKHLFVSTSTIKTHLIHIYQKLEVNRRTQAILKAKSLQIIP